MIKKFLNVLESFSLGAIAIIGLLLSVFDLFGWSLVDDERLPIITLFVLSAIGLYLILERRNSLGELQKDIDFLKEKPDEIIDALDGVKVIKFKDAFELLEHATMRVQELVASKDPHWIDDTSWGFELGHDAQLPQNKKISSSHREQMQLFAEENTHREIFIFNRPHQRVTLKRRLENENMGGYSCAYYQNNPDLTLLKFMIIDEEEVILLADTFDGNMSITHPKIAKMFKIYYQNLWNNAEVIKDATGPRSNVIDALNRRFAKEDPNFRIELPE